jgi:small-conductance mechanosensitive channel/CRP-like cAMP-binding protein
MTRFLLAAALWLGVSASRRVLLRGRSDAARTFGIELRPPQLLLALYLLGRAAAFALQGVDATLHHASATAAYIAGAAGVLRLGEALLFAVLRLRAAEGIPRLLRSLVAWAGTFVVAAVVLRLEYRLNLSSLLATSALLSVVLGFALQEALGNLFSGLTLHAEQPFDRGEWVSFGKWRGKVLDVGWRSTRLLTLDDDEILVPNGLISREVVVNHSRPTVQDCVQLSLTVDLEVAPARAKAALLEAVSSCARVLQEPPPTVQLGSFEPSGAVYRVRFFTDSHALEREAIDEVHEAIWYALRRAAIDLPYPQTMLSFRERAGEAEERRRREHLADAEDLLSRIDFLATLRAADRKLIAERARFVEYGPREAVVRQGESGDVLYLVARGELEVRVRVENSEKEVARLGRGAFFGEMSLLTGEPRTATVVALTEAALLAVDREAFSRVFAQNVRVAEELAGVIARRRRDLDAARAEAGSSQQEEETNLLSRIGAMFGFGGRATG